MVSFVTTKRTDGARVVGCLRDDGENILRELCAYVFCNALGNESCRVHHLWKDSPHSQRRLLVELCRIPPTVSFKMTARDGNDMDLLLIILTTAVWLSSWNCTF